MKRILILFLLFAITFLPISAKTLKTKGEVLGEFDTEIVLPKDLIQVIATQIDPEIFAKMLSGEFPDLLMNMLAG